MAKECIHTCPNIQKHHSSMESDNYWAGVGPLHPDVFQSESGVSFLLRLCEATYECSGPVKKVVQVEKPRNLIQIFTGGEVEVVEEIVYECGLPNETELIENREE